MEYLPLVLLAALFWLLILRPQRRRASAQAQLWESIRKGDEVVTTGGVFGRVDDVEDDAVRLEIAPGTVVRLDKRAVARRVEPLQTPDDPG